MIIGSGWAKSMKMKVPGGDSTRPTSAKVRAAALNTLAPWLDSANVLDVFAGAGGMGIEALSRGAKACVFVESGKQALRCLHENVAELKRRAEKQQIAVPDVHILGSDASSTGDRLKHIFKPDVIFIDPPYVDVPRWVDDLVIPLRSNSHSDTILMLEHDNSELTLARLESGVSGWKLVKQKTYSDTMLSLFEFEGE
jgi:16S rRNA (guanine966-N2)-methyltransferase